jgi:hypothetical protein
MESTITSHRGNAAILADRVFLVAHNLHRTMMLPRIKEQIEQAMSVRALRNGKESIWTTGRVLIMVNWAGGGVDVEENTSQTRKTEYRAICSSISALSFLILTSVSLAGHQITGCARETACLGSLWRKRRGYQWSTL